MIKSKLLLKISIVALFSSAGLYIIHNWNNYDSIEPQNIKYSSIDIDIKNIKTKYTKNDIWFIKNNKPVVAFQIIFRNEGQRNFKDKPGILGLLCNSIFEGAGNYNKSQIYEKIIDNNISIDFSHDNDNIILSVYTISKNFKMVMDLLSDILTKSHFPSSNLENNKDEIIKGLSQSKFSTESVGMDLLTKTIYKKDHPYYSTIDDILNNIKNYTHDDIIEVYNKIFTSKNAIISISGNITEEEITKEFNILFEKLQIKHNNFKNVKQETNFENIGSIKYEVLNNPMSSIYFAIPGILKDDRNLYSVIIANMILGGRDAIFNTRLFKDIRDKQGLVYNISTSLSNSDCLSMILGFASTRPENIDKIIDSIKNEFKTFAEKGITKEELEYYKIIVSSHKTIMNSKDLVSFITSLRLMNIDKKSIKNYMNNFYDLKLDDVNKIMKNVFDYRKLTFIIAGPNNNTKLENNSNENTKNH